MERGHNTRYRIGPYMLEPAERRLLSENFAPIELTTKAFDLLVLLVIKAGQLVTKEEILDAVWQDVSVAESNLTTTISMLRKALQEDSGHRFIETIPKKGYRFVAPVSIVTAGQGPDAGPADPISPPLARNEKRLGRIGFVGMFTVILGTALAIAILHFVHPARNGSRTLYLNAVRYDAEGKDDLAIRELTEVQPSDPMFVTARIKLAWLLYQADKNDEAMRSLEPVLSGQSSGSAEPRDESTRLKVEGMKQLLTDQPNTALLDFRSAGDSNPRDVDALIYTADTAIATGNFPEADKALDECAAIDRSNPFCGYERIDALTDERKYDKAIAEYDRLGDSKYPWMDEPAGYAELARDNIDEALKHFNSLIARGPTGSRVHFLAAQDGIVAADLLGGKMATARRDLTTAKNQANSGYEKADYLILMAEIGALNGNPSQAKVDLEAASKLSDSPAFAIDIARTYAMIGDDSNARSFLVRAQKVKAGRELEYGAAEPFIDGLESLRRKNFKTASEQLNTSFSMNQIPETAYFLAEAEMGLGDWNAAIDHLDFIISNKAKVFIDSVALLVPLSEYELGNCYRDLGKESQADKHYFRVCSMWEHADPDLKARFCSRADGVVSR